MVVVGRVAALSFFTEFVCFFTENTRFFTNPGLESLADQTP